MAVLKLLRNQTLYETRDAALSAITTKAEELGDGEIWIATYGTSPNAKSILAIKRSTGLTVFDNETSSDSITAAIEALNNSDTAVAKKFVTSVSETNGIISVSRGEVTSNDNSVTLTAGDNGGIDLAVNVDDSTIVKSEGNLAVGTVSAAQVSVDNTDAGITATTAQAAFKELKSAINNVDGKAKSYTIEKQTTGLATNVKEQYVLKEIVGKTKTPVGEPINIYKDSSLKEVKLQDQNLMFTYILADGTEKTVPVDVSTFLAETEFKDGLTVENHVVKVKVDTASEKFLTVGENGVKLSGVQTAINNAKAAATTKVVEGTDAGNNLQIVPTTSDADGSTTYTINLSDVASKKALDAEIKARKAVDGQTGQTYAANAGTNYISGATSLNDADIKLDAELKKEADSAKAEVTRAKAAEKEIADKVGLTGNEGTRVFGPTTNYGTGTTTVKANMQAIDSALKEVDDAMLTGITQSNAISVSTKANKNQTVSLKLDTTTGDNALSITSNGLYLSSIIDCGTY